MTKAVLRSKIDDTKKCFILIESYKPFQNFGKKYFFLSNCILSSKLPQFVVPIHSGNAVYVIFFLKKLRIFEIPVMGSSQNVEKWKNCIFTWKLPESTRCWPNKLSDTLCGSAKLSGRSHFYLWRRSPKSDFEEFCRFSWMLSGYCPNYNSTKSAKTI